MEIWISHNLYYYFITFLFLWASCPQYTMLTSVTDLGVSNCKLHHPLIIQPMQLHEYVWLWLSQESGCKWSRQGRSERKDSWREPQPGLRSSLTPVGLLPPQVPALPHQYLIGLRKTHMGWAGVPTQPSAPLGKQHHGIFMVIFLSPGLRKKKKPCLACIP
jgi:hypothetical protein